MKVWIRIREHNYRLKDLQEDLNVAQKYFMLQDLQGKRCVQMKIANVSGMTVIQDSN